MTRFKLMAGISFAVTLLLIVSCSDNPALRGRYLAEKMFFEAERAARQAQIRPDLSGPDLPKRLRDNYRRTLAFCDAALDSTSAEQYPVEIRELRELSYKAATRLSQLYFADRQFDSCFSIYGRLLADASVTGVARIGAYLSLGEALQAAGRWDSALVVYQYAVDSLYPPVGPRGEIISSILNLPMSILGIYDRLGDTAAASDQLRRANEYYARIIEDFPGSDLQNWARSNLAGLYERAGQWEEAIGELSRLTDSSGNVSIAAGQRIADIHARRLNNRQVALEEYGKLLDRLDGSDTSSRPVILLKMILTRLDEEEYATARQLLKDLKDNFPVYFSSTPVAQWAVARSFELQGNWDRAETEYRFLIEKYSGSQQAFAAFFHLADQYLEQGRRTEAERIEQQAEEEFSRIAANEAGTLQEALALNYQAELYRRRGDWPRVVEILASISRKFPRSDFGYRALLAASAIYREEMDNPRAADSLLAEFKKNLPVVDDKTEF
jgi:tetratricopeptide (TPR) repeat protein